MTTHFPHGTTDREATHIFGDLPVRDLAKVTEWFEDFYAFDSDQWSRSALPGPTNTQVLEITDSAAFAGLIQLRSDNTSGSWAQITGEENALSYQVRTHWAARIGLHEGIWDDTEALVGMNEIGENILGGGEVDGVFFRVVNGIVTLAAYLNMGIVTETDPLMDFNDFGNDLVALQMIWDPESNSAEFGLDGVPSGTFAPTENMRQVQETSHVGAFITNADRLAAIKLDYFYSSSLRDATVVAV